MNTSEIIVMFFMNFGASIFGYLFMDMIFKLLVPKNLDDYEKGIKNMSLLLFCSFIAVIMTIFYGRGTIEDIKQTQDNPVIVQIEDNTK